jgi:DNA polymerase I
MLKNLKVTKYKHKEVSFLYSIKQSFSNCSRCDLLGAPSCILETNCEDDLRKVDVIFVAENPGRDEVKKELPLVGKAGQMFRKYFNKFGLNKMNYLLTNVVLCQTLIVDKVTGSKTTGNPTSNVIDLCKPNCMNIIKACEPKLIVLMGGSPMEAFGFGKGGITKKHDYFLDGGIDEWEGFKTAIIVHPSFVNRNTHVWEPRYEAAMARVASIMSGKTINVDVHAEAKPVGKGIYRYKIPDKFYTDDYRLVDVQFLNKTNQVLYIFRDKNNKKVYHKENDDYICYRAPKGVDARRIVPYDDLDQIKIKYKDRYNLDPKITYEGDVRITVKHAMDYYHYNKGEAPTNLNIMFADIEVDTGEERVFPKPADAAFPINMLTTSYNGVKTHYVVDNKTAEIEQVEGVNMKIFNNEKSMMREFIKDFKNTDPDFIAGWNLINFDMDYIYNRLPKLGMSQSALSKFGEMYVDGFKYICHIPGCVVIDQDFLYRTFTFTKMENYKLGFIAAHELDGVTKLQLPLPFNEMYWKLINETIKYNIRDVELLERLDNQLAHINLLNELRIICNTSFDSVSSFGQIDSIMVSYLRERGLASRNGDPHVVKEKYPGAFVFQPTPGVYEHITDFDFASLYPSLMITYNIGVNSFVMKTKDPELGYDIAYQPDKLPKKFKMIIDPLYEAKVVEITPEQLFKKVEECSLVHTINGCFFKPHKEAFSSFGEVVDMLMSSRKDYKGKMFDAIEAKDEHKRQFYFTRQLVYKVLANTLYGVVANKAFRFFDTSLAAAITLSGQEALKTSIIYGHEYMKSIIEETDMKEPKPLTKREMFDDAMPDRSNEYIVTGDTDSIFCCFEKAPQEKSVKNIHKWCEGIETFLNDNIMIDMVKKHRVDLDFNRLKLKNELVISRGLFLAKKRYAIRVINNEGKDVDQINFMGVEIKRSDYPSESKEFMKKLSDMILKSDKVRLPKILDYVQSEENRFKKLIEDGDKGVARPISWGKEIRDYKLIPQGVKAMQAWNDIMYPIHKVGNKAYMFWVRGIDLEKAPKEVIDRYHKFIKSGKKLEVIGVPDEEEKLPEYFIPDRDTALNFSFKDRYELLLKPLTEDEIRKQQATILTF